MTTLADDLVPDELWALVEPLLPVPPRPPYGGRHRTIPDRNCFAAIVFMARTSTPWRLLPAQELGCGSPATCWRRLTEWAKAGVFAQERQAARTVSLILSAPQCLGRKAKAPAAMTASADSSVS